MAAAAGPVGSEYCLVDTDVPPVRIQQSTTFESHDDARAQQSLKEAFDMYDIDGNGTLDVDEFCSLLACLDLHITVPEARDILNEMDCDASGSMEFDEWVRLMTRHKVTREQEMQSTWELYDEKRTGQLRIEDVRRCLEKIGIHMLSEELQARALLVCFMSAMCRGTRLQSVERSPNPITTALSYGEIARMRCCRQCSMLRTSTTATRLTLKNSTRHAFPFTLPSCR